MFPHQYIHKHTWTSHNGKTHNQIDNNLIARRWHLGTGCTILHGTDCDTDNNLVMAKVRENSQYMSTAIVTGSKPK
jgi:hypothetical protein